MKLFHANVIKSGRWLVARTLEEPRITTQGRNLDELVFMVRDAIELMTGETDIHLELILPPKVAGAKGRRAATAA